MITVGHRSDQAYVFFCTSADTLPTTVGGGLAIPIGSDLYLTDTNNQLKWTGTAWYNFAQDVEEVPYSPLILALNNSIQQNSAVLSQLLAAQQYTNMLLGASTATGSDDHDTVSSTLM